MSANETAQVSAVPTFDCRQTFVETLIELATADKRIVAVCTTPSVRATSAPLPSSSRIVW